MEQTESWDYNTLFNKTFHYEAPYLIYLEREGFIGDLMDFQTK
jgi:hypothetical protein